MASDPNTNLVSDDKDSFPLGAEAGSSNDVGHDARANNNGIDQDVSGDGGLESAGSAGDSSEAQATQISMRTLIVTSDASIIIGKQGKHINEIRDKSNARLNIVSTLCRKLTRCGQLTIHYTLRQSEIIAGNPERILTVSGPLDAVSKVSALAPNIRVGMTAS